MAARAAAPTPAPMPAFTAVESPVVAASVLGVDAGAEVAVGPEVPEVVDSEDTETGTEAVGDGDAEVAEDETGAVVDVLLDTGELAVVLVTVVLIVVLWEVDSGLETGVVVETAAAGVEEDATSVGVGSEVDAAAELVGIAGAALAALAAAAFAQMSLP